MNKNVNIMAQLEVSVHHKSWSYNINLYHMGIGDLKLYTMDFNPRINNLVVCYCDAWPAGSCISHDARLIKRVLHCRETHTHSTLIQL
jgi:hypothetical protein